MFLFNNFLINLARATFCQACKDPYERAGSGSPVPNYQPSGSAPGNWSVIQLRFAQASYRFAQAEQHRSTDSIMKIATPPATAWPTQQTSSHYKLYILLTPLILDNVTSGLIWPSPLIRFATIAPYEVVPFRLPFQPALIKRLAFKPTQ